MPTEVIMPKVDMDMERGKITAWLVAEGARVAGGEPLFEIETDKAAMEVESPADGVLHHIVASEGTEVAIGQPVAWVYGEDEAVGAVPAPAQDDTSADASAAPPPKEPPMELQGSATPSDQIAATPAAKRLAREMNVALNALIGTGPMGRIQARDVEQARAPTQTEPAAQVFEPLAVTSSGRGSATPIVMIHGMASEALGWAALKAELPKGYPVHCIELPGHGRSPLRSVGSFSELVHVLRDAFDALVDGPVNLVGHSLGGALALAIADTRPRLVADLTLISPAGLGPDINGAALDGVLRANQAESLAPWLRTFVSDESAVTENYVQSVMFLRANPDLRRVQRETASALFPDGTPGFDLNAALQRVQCPARIIWGRQDRIVPWRHALRAPGRMALHLFDNTGHMPHIERAGEVATLISAAIRP